MDTRQTMPIILTVPTFEDFRGYLAVPYDKSINFNVRQINQGYSKKEFTLRGLHFQEGEHAQAKLVSCLRGSIFNVAVDLHPGETFGHAYSAVLSFENRKQMLIPRGFAHGYLTLEDDTLMQWCVDNDFCAEAARAVRYDSDFIWESESWPAGEYIVSEKDRNAEKFSLANCWKQMMKFQQRFADDEDILKAIAGAADALYDIYRENQVPGRRCKLLKDMERIFDETHNADVANALAILEANEHTIYDPPAVFDSNKSEILLSTENKLKEIYEVFPNEGKVVLGYSYLVSWNYVTWLDFPRPIDEELIPLFKKWIRKFPENKLELMEYYSFILFEKWLYMDSLDNISEANKIYYEIKAIADELSKDYADNQVTQMLSMGIVRKL